MIWVVSLIIALLAYFLFQGLHARHVSRCHTDNRTAEHIPDYIATPKTHTEFHQQSAAAAARVQSERMGETQIGEPHYPPSLLYADRSNAAHRQGGNHNQYSDTVQNQQPAYDGTVSDTTMEKSSALSGGTQCTPDDVIDMELASDHTTDHTLEFTAEHEPMGDVGVPDNNSAYATNNESRANTGAGLAAAGAAAAGIAAAASVQGDDTNEKFRHEYDNEYTSQENTLDRESTLDRDGTLERPSSHSAGTSENIDVELGESDNTFSDTEYVAGRNHDELLDFGDLTSDISDMLKELNLRESDSPRLDINKAEFEQLKTGEPGEVKPAKIENVADKLRNMLQ